MMDHEQELKDKLLQSLIDKMEDILGEGMKPEPKGLAVEVAAPDKEHLADGLDKAKDVLKDAPMPEGHPGMEAPDAEDDKSDAERLAELLGDDGDDDEDEDKLKQR